MKRSKIVRLGLPFLALVFIGLPLYLWLATLVMQNAISINSRNLAEFSIYLGSVNTEFDDIVTTPLMMAADRCSDNAVKVFLPHKARVNSATRSSGDTALILAAEKGCTSVVQLLIDSHADVNQTNKAGKTPLIAAARNDHPEIVQILLEKGADIHPKDINGLDVRSAAKYGKADRVLMLLNDGVEYSEHLRE